MTGPVDETPPLVWRLPSWQPAALFLVTAGLAAWAIYVDSSSAVRAIVILLAVAFFLAAVAAARMYVVADDDGVGVRRYAGESSLRWEQISGIAVTRLRGGSMTLELQSPDHAGVTVPPSLVLPLKPTSIARTSTLLTVRAQELGARRPAGKPPAKALD